MATVVLADALARLFPGAPREQQVDAADVAAVLDLLDARWPGMRDRVADSTPRIRRHLDVFVDGRKAGLETPVAAHSEVLILTAMSGG
ncbi:MoaD/ThiS family protein [Roseococcus sp. SYP-B2431]|uniref:MoaD/ThiS family protein n=1 Tax=Roseococcus sp. SYP-B2431 TaxID=2496640 RepID=UPI00103A7627|nr:MoaD/ThiS family protein [Roseococcus sp. SYP-B2431]TCH97568.1 MoaD/ThiS family protein [Roseococcus sp. SYP-B2431]